MDNNRNIDNKRQWTKPQLIVLVRSSPAESVLQGCKYTGYGFPSPGTTYSACQDACAPCAVLEKS